MEIHAKTSIIPKIVSNIIHHTNITSTLPLIYKSPQSRRLQSRESKLIAKKGVCFNKFFKLNQHDAASCFRVTIFRELFIFPNTSNPKQLVKSNLSLSRVS